MIQKVTAGLPWPVIVFLIGLVTPWVLPVGPLNMSVYRFVVLGTLLPCLVMWGRGKAGPIRIADVGLIIFCLWASVSLAVVHGIAASIEPIGILIIETLGSYWLGRCFIRSAEDFRNMVRLAAKLVLLLSPFALYEWITGAKPILSTLGAIFPTVEISMMQPRWGFWRVQGPFSHSILFGLFCGSIVALTYLVSGRERSSLARGLSSAAVGGTAFLSMSSAPIAGMMLQLMLIGWNWLFGTMQSRWKVFWGLVLIGYLVVEFGSNQTPIGFYISHFTFDSQTGWYRLAIWEHGTASVLNHPLFGIGLGDWVRPSWMGSDSVDNFWLLIAMRHGIPAVVTIGGVCLWLACSIGFRKGLDETLRDYRMAYLVCLSSFMVVGGTVHFWTSIYVWFLFLLGSGVWILDASADGAIPAGSSYATDYNSNRKNRNRSRSTAAPRILSHARRLR